MNLKATLEAVWGVRMANLKNVIELWNRVA